jgi:TRAP-type C4-dicarboxylate transport system substrate-binding protein
MHTLDDLKGLRVACVTPREAASLKLLGATPVNMPMPEHFTAQERGVVDATSNDFNADFIWKIFEITKYRTDNVDITQRDCPIIMNMKTYDSLPSDLKATFDQLTDGLTMSKKVAAAYLEFAAFTYAQTVEYDKKVGNPGIYVLPDDEKARWLEKAMPVREQWVSELKDKGVPSEEMLKDLLAFAAQYK